MKETRLITGLKNGLKGELAVPGDKSISHRALLIGAISQGKTVIDHFLKSQDCLHTLGALQQLGVTITEQNSQVQVWGQGIEHLSPSAAPLEMGNSGTTTRLMLGLLAGRPFDSYFQGDASLSQRPMKRVSEPLAKMGAEIALTAAGTLPAKVKGHKLHGKKIALQVASAQVKSAVIFAGLQADNPTKIIEKLPTRNHTELMLRQFGAEIITAADQRTITVIPKPKLLGQQIQVPGDPSSAAFFMAAATLVPESSIILKNVSLNPTRTGFLRILQKMGGKVSILNQTKLSENSGDLKVESAKLHAIQLTAADIPAVIDELPLVALLAARATGKSKITGAEELRVKETDRIATVTEELSKLGVNIQELPDGLVISGSTKWQPVTNQLDSHGDHRIGMMLAVAALCIQGSLKLQQADAVKISYPGFFADLQQLIV
ncbi:MAG: 3-phosphoshikimate 1-carboxyvinyltransferase [Liquorilactobacillus nagelii]|jgi:3-phosphoshikimate 1-carboxyvinyltransferase|uniref:3-phosphoshikimate 1-carboxyvinyltransferase n=1 Tax=Liquorilactobacillus nagelii TaxID=82688 RepID=UPI00242B24F8|nr:3-phosphoshikimate 1-carboxyvinyltransferase [Liquorilactobacillus nagelii]MCI1633224.1 3-phosphoshikimate 1-carboxyvinyltransferase [Liquorilactobacillus nagelii]MCI1921108.1 3-phosphoshikimate 1-carboxyvinyltransferase [Liquorilactobacillus nagelii]MCI1975700.1 3-phosphoshikimate 1-carboxyvinyltransferase [Liquorilactobacillus nagelii]